MEMDEFIYMCVKIHKGLYSYENVNYINTKTKIYVTCETHGDFEVTPNNHIHRKSGCPECKKMTKYNRAKFINKANVIYNNKFTYIEDTYVNNRRKMEIVCEIHGTFTQSPQTHINIGCKLCNRDKLNEIKRERLIEVMNNIHNNFYNYEKTIYTTRHSDDVIITCPKHGDFNQSFHSHLKGHGCQKCSSSKGEKIITKYLNENNIKFISEYKFNKCVYKRKLIFDFHLPNYNICIEYDGRQHYESISHFGGDIEYEQTKIRDKIKSKYCLDNGIKLIRISYKNINKIYEILDKSIMNQRYP